MWNLCCFSLTAPPSKTGNILSDLTEEIVVENHAIIRHVLQWKNHHVLSQYY